MFCRSTSCCRSDVERTQAKSLYSCQKWVSHLYGDATCLAKSVLRISGMVVPAENRVSFLQRSNTRFQIVAGVFESCIPS